MHSHRLCYQSEAWRSLDHLLIKIVFLVYIVWMSTIFDLPFPAATWSADNSFVRSLAFTFAPWSINNLAIFPYPERYPKTNDSPSIIWFLCLNPSIRNQNHQIIYQPFPTAICSGDSPSLPFAFASHPFSRSIFTICSWPWQRERVKHQIGKSTEKIFAIFTFIYSQMQWCNP